MICIILPHPVATGQQEEAERRVRAVTQLFQGEKGFISRVVHSSQEGPNTLTTINNWESAEDFQNWNRTSDVPWDASDMTPWSGPLKPEIFDVTSDVWAEGVEQGRNGITVIAHHWADPDLQEKADQRLQANTELAHRIQGFQRRQVLHSREDPTKLTTVTTWGNMEGYDAWYEARDINAPQLWSRPVEAEFFTVEPDL